MDEWPDLPYEWWRSTRDTLHLYTQVVGKLRLALSPFEPQWANVPLYLTARGLTTSPVPYGSVTFDAELDLFDHVLVVRVSDGGLARVPLRGPVAEFYGAVKAALHDLGLSVAISELPSEIPGPIPFPMDRTHQTYESAKAHRFWRVLSQVDVVMKRHRARFRGKTSPVHFFWGSFDLANTRLSGRPASPPPGADTIARYSEDAEQICAGFWPGDQRTQYPAFFAYSYPKPDGIELAKLRPEAARWVDQAGLFLLPYEAVRTAPAPGAAILEFLDSTYLACATGLGWSTDLVSAEQPPAGTST
ncbi:MAG: DUF5996 family protein [Candidatus Dormibacteraeota bacterium]|nr:DUF5996 family protein [Candidatus Dormibacteraeota bacterium]